MPNYFDQFDDPQEPVQPIQQDGRPKVNHFDQFDDPVEQTQEPVAEETPQEPYAPNYNTDAITKQGVMGAAASVPYLLGTAKAVRAASKGAKSVSSTLKNVSKVPVLNLGFALDDAVGELTGGYQLQGALSNTIGGLINLSSGEKFYDGSLHDYFSTNRHEEGDPFGATQRSKHLGNRGLGALDAFGNTLLGGSLDVIRHASDKHNKNFDQYDEDTGRQSDPFYTGRLAGWLAEKTLFPQGYPADPRFKRKPEQTEQPLPYLP